MLIHSVKLKGFVSFLTLLLILAFSTQTGQGQTTSNTIETENYVLALPSAKWHVETEAGIARNRTYFIYEDEEAVELNIRRVLVESGVSATDLIQQRQQWERVSTPGYVKTSTGKFEGEVDGAKYAYEYVSDGRVIGKLVYFLQTDTRTIYRLEFTGSQAKMSDIADEIEFIAKSFRAR